MRGGTASGVEQNGRAQAARRRAVWIHPSALGRYVLPAKVSTGGLQTCVLSELGKSLRAGDLSVAGSRRYRDFDDYLLPAQTFAAMRTAGLPLAIEIDAEKYLA